MSAEIIITLIMPYIATSVVLDLKKISFGQFKFAEIVMMNTDQGGSKALAYLNRLKEYNAVAGLKTGFEVEDFDDDELLFLQNLAIEADLPLTVKIGGPEARRDIRFCVEHGISKILAPMIESVYALDLFVRTANSLIHTTNTKLAMNLESFLAYSSLDSFISSSAFEDLDSVTIGRGDLSASMHLDVDDPEVMRITLNSINKIKNAGKQTSVGGGLKVAQISNILETLPSDWVNTRHVILSRKAMLPGNAHQVLSLALRFELELYRSMVSEFSKKTSLYNERIQILKERLKIGEHKLSKERA